MYKMSQIKSIISVMKTRARKGKRWYNTISLSNCLWFMWDMWCKNGFLLKNIIKCTKNLSTIRIVNHGDPYNILACWIFDLQNAFSGQIYLIKSTAFEKESNFEKPYHNFSILFLFLVLHLIWIKLCFKATSLCHTLWPRGIRRVDVTVFRNPADSFGVRSRFGEDILTAYNPNFSLK